MREAAQWKASVQTFLQYVFQKHVCAALRMHSAREAIGQLLNSVVAATVRRRQYITRVASVRAGCARVFDMVLPAKKYSTLGGEP